jgi:hypothetical protein
MGRPTITVPAAPPPPPAPPIIPAAPIFGRTEEEKLKRKLFDPRRVGRQQTILTGPRGLLDSETKRKKLGAGDTSKDS